MYAKLPPKEAIIAAIEFLALTAYGQKMKIGPALPILRKIVAETQGFLELPDGGVRIGHGSRLLEGMHVPFNNTNDAMNVAEIFGRAILLIDYPYGETWEEGYFSQLIGRSLSIGGVKDETVIQFL